MSLLYKKEIVYQVDFSSDGEQIKIEVSGNIGKHGCDEPLFDWEGSVKEFMELLSNEK